jgi:hypothetical protein
MGKATGSRDGDMSTRVFPWIAWSVCVLTIMLVGFSVTFSVFYQSNLQGLTFFVFVVSSALVGAVVASLRTLQSTNRPLN